MCRVWRGQGDSSSSCLVFGVIIERLYSIYQSVERILDYAIFRREGVAQVTLVCSVGV